MKLMISTLALIAGLGLATGAMAQDTPSGGPNAKGNAPLKSVHSVNDGAPKRGANSFTQNEAKKHILNSGYTDVSALTKGKDGVWRGTASKDGSSRDVALDFKGNVSEGGSHAAADQAAQAVGVKPRAMVSATNAGGASMATSGMAETPASGMHHSSSRMAMRHHRHWRHRHHMMHARCAHPGPNGAACSGADHNMNGISDKEDHAIRGGAHP